MTEADIAHQRLQSQQLSTPQLERAQDVVGWLVAVQAQDYGGAKWALGLRIPGATDSDIELAFNQGNILRTHLLRPTWHFVTPADIRWLLAISAPRVHAANGGMYRRLGMEADLFKRSNDLIGTALQGGRQLTRNELRSVLQNAGIVVDSGLRMSYFMMSAELDGIVCSGKRRGRQFTYALLDERAPGGKMLERELALAELARRYFLSRGPATVQDFAKWSGMTLADARLGLSAVQSQLEQTQLEGQTYWYSPSAPPEADSARRAHLLSIYDEYFSGYKDRSAVADSDVVARLMAMGNALTGAIVLDGWIVGYWRRTLGKDAVVVETNYFSSPSKSGQNEIVAAAQRYGEFLGLPVVMA